jgi:PAS domain-containing protein
VEATAEQHPIEIIMARGLMSNLTTPAFLVDQEGTLIFFNDAAGELLGVRFEEAGAMPAGEWATRFKPVSADGRPLPPQELPLTIALHESRPAHAAMGIHGQDGVDRHIEVSAFPIVGRSGQTGAIAIFWSTPV